jgi:hypothetical protein
LSSTNSFLAEAYLGQDKALNALDSARRGLELAEEMESREDLGVAWRALGRVAANLREPILIKAPGKEQPRIVGAEACFAESERIFTEIERKEERARTLREWAKYLLEQGDQNQGMHLWEEAKKIFAQLGAQPEVERMENIYAN